MVSEEKVICHLSGSQKGGKQTKPDETKHLGIFRSDSPRIVCFSFVQFLVPPFLHFYEQIEVYREKLITYFKGN